MNTQLMIAGYCPVGNYSFEIIYKKYHTFFVHYAEKTMGEELYAEDVDLSICYSRLIILYRKVQY